MFGGKFKTILLGNSRHVGLNIDQFGLLLKFIDLTYWLLICRYAKPLIY